MPLFHFNADVVLMFLDFLITSSQLEPDDSVRWDLFVLVFTQVAASKTTRESNQQLHDNIQTGNVPCSAVWLYCEPFDLIHLRQQVPTLSCDSFGSSWIWRNRHSSQQTAHGVKPQSTTEVNETHTLTACYINIYIQQNIVHVIYTVKFMTFFLKQFDFFFS